MKLSGPLVLIDDDQDDQVILTDILSRIGITDQLRLFDECTDALDYLKTTKEKPFMIICDVNLPGMNGIEFRKAINEDEYLRRKSIPFIFLTTSAMPKHVIEAYDLTVQGFFVKQFSIDAMREILKNILLYWTNCVHPNSVR